jgi:threonine/homoserine efflux transporter RhtA
VIMFAVRRTARVPGRIRFLTVSIKTMKGISGVGVPWGTGCSNMWFMFLIHPNNINVTHRGRARVSVNTKCLVLVQFPWQMSGMR